VSIGMRSAQGILAVCCLLFGILPTSVIQLMNTIPEQLLGQGLVQATSQGWLWLTPISADTASYGAPIVLIGLLAAWWLSSLLLRRGSVREVRRCDAWDCGFSPPNARMQYTATAFAQPIRRVFGLLFHIDERIEREAGIRHRLRVTDRAWGLFYEPIAKTVQAAARRVALIQSGNVRVYLGWSLGTLLVLLWLIS
jgi:hydrogenase-4 component B